MKILVFSDSHHQLHEMRKAVETETPDMVIHLGDLLCDAKALAERYPDLPLKSVPGNCDGWMNTPGTIFLEAAGRRILMGHGHLWQVKQGYEKAVSAARAADADILLFGHTHVPFCCLMEGIWVLNPGAISGGMKTFGLIVLEKGNTICYIKSN